MNNDFTPFNLEGRTLDAIVLDEDNVHLAAEVLGGTVLYNNGQPTGLWVAYGLEADLGDYLVRSDRDVLVTDPETFDFFFNPINEQHRKRTMAVEPIIYVRKPFEVEAVEVTEDNLEEVAEWCHGDLREDNRPYIKVRVARALNERQTKAYPGDWVLYAGTGFKVYTPKAFDKTFIKKESVLIRSDDGETSGEIAMEPVNIG